MAFSDWDVYKSDGSGVTALETSDPLVGTASLVMHRGTTTTANQYRSNLVSKGVTHTPVGVLRGALAGTFQVPTSFTVDGPGTQYAGMLALQNLAGAMQAGSTGWAMMFGTTAAAGTTSLRVARFSTSFDMAGLETSPVWQIALTPAIPLGTIFTLEFEWDADAAYGGVRYIVRRGTQSNYNDLVIVVDAISTTFGVPVFTAGEGPGISQTTGSTVNYRCLVDQWRLRA